MGVPQTCQETISRVRNQVSDPSAEVWTDAKVLQAVDQALESIWTTVKLAQRAHLLASEVVLTSAMTAVGRDMYEYTLPEYVGGIELIEAVFGDQAVPLGHGDTVDISMRNRARCSFYVRTGPSTVRLIRASASSFRIWFYRRWPPMHYGLAASGSTTTLGFSATPTGTVKQRGLYKGSRIELLAGANKDALVEVTDYNPTTNVVTFAALGAAVATSTLYSLVLPLDGEHGDYVAVEASIRLLQRAGNTDYLAPLMSLQAQLRERFVASIHQRDMDHARSL